MRLLIFLTFFQFYTFAEEVKYFNNIFGHVHTKKDNFSPSLTNMACGHPVKVLRSDTESNGKWNYVKVGAHTGYVRPIFLQKNRPECFQKKYNSFFSSHKLELTDLYYWGRLYDQYISGKSSLK